MENRTMRRYVIERDLPGLGDLNRDQLRGAAQTSNATLAELGTGIQWEHSYVTQNRMFCIYLAENEQIVREHAKRGGFPATIVTEVKSVIDPLTGMPNA
jgi:Nickel responsive protein SCO4226-like